MNFSFIEVELKKDQAQVKGSTIYSHKISMKELAYDEFGKY